jgi:hypothetical protein
MVYADAEMSICHKSICVGLTLRDYGQSETMFQNAQHVDHCDEYDL